MKKICLLVASLALVMSLSLPSAHAQAVDHDAIVTALQGMKQDINKMIQLVERHKAASLTVGEEQVNLSAAQLTQIINKYIALKADLAVKYGALP